jgi:hypothetical protein
MKRKYSFSANSDTMSPFAKSPHLWLTEHLRRIEQQEGVPKIQALVRGFLARRRQQKKLRAAALIKEAEQRIQTREQPVSLADTLVRLNLSLWAEGLPTATEALQSEEIADKRRGAIRHASICLRFLGQSHLIPDIEWADYHERAAALRGTIHPDNMWSRFTKRVWG